MLRHIPNVLTALRIATIAPLCWLLWHERYLFALWLLALAGLSDVLDGFLARRYGWFSRLGAYLDPLADKLFIIALVVLFGVKGYLPVWLVWLILGRDVLIVMGAVLYRWVVGYLDMKPLLISKLNTALQIGLLGVTLLHAAFASVAPEWICFFQGLVTVTTVLSGASYVFIWAYDAFKRTDGRTP